MAERVFSLPDLGEGLDEGTVVSWLVAEGDDVALNQPLVEIETAKASVEIPSPFAGRILRLDAEVDGVVAVGAPLATFEVAGEIAPAGGPGDGLAPREAATTPAAASTTPSTAKVATTPVVRKLAKDLGVDLRVIEGTGPGGRITSDDVHAAAGGTTEAAPATDERVSRMPLTATRKAIAENLERQWSIPQVTTFRTVDCSALETFRGELGVSPLPVVVAALAAIVPSHPLANAAWGGDAILLSSAVHVGLAADTDRGLVVPVLRDADSLGIAEIAGAIRRLADGARAATLGPSELSGATIAVSNTGSYGSEAGTPILSPGTSVTLALGVIAPRPLVIAGQVEVRPAATISLTFDHRVLDGAAAGRALGDLVDLLQSSERLRDLPR
jgi:pyruvate dehydrogenase E2 component (dihydrolipoamide acetyltransferase)